jgi:hypothetical protein
VLEVDGADGATPHAPSMTAAFGTEPDSKQDSDTCDAVSPLQLLPLGVGTRVIGDGNLKGSIAKLEYVSRNLCIETESLLMQV